MKYAILRTQKLKSPIAVRRSMKHAFREQVTPNADPTRQHNNTHMGAHSVAEGIAAFNAALPAKVRKNAVLAIEYLMTASPEAMASKSREQQDQYFDDALEWLKERHGQDNIVYAGIHRDETTPHMYAYVVPIDPDTGRLNCRRFLGGAKALSEMQTDFAERVGKQHGLQRGIEGSRAKHQRVSQFYGAIERPHAPLTLQPEQVQPRVLKKKLFSEVKEEPEVLAKRLNKKIGAHYAPAMLEATSARQERRRAAEMTKTSESMSKRLKAAQQQLQASQKAFEGLSEAEILEAVNHAVKFHKEKQIQAEVACRVAVLPDLVRKAVGSVKVFMSIALGAIQAQAGRWQDVDWGQVDQDTIKEATQKGLSPYTTAKAILDHSPSHAGMTAEDRERALIRIKNQLTSKEKDQATHEAKEQELGSGRGFSR